MTETSLAVIILAAGKGTRMKSDLPKVLHKIAGQPMLAHVIQTAERLSPQKIVIVAAPDQGDAFKTHVGMHDIAIQDQQLGTGHAVRCAETALKNFTGDILVLYGDVPLISADTLQSLLNKKQQTKAAVAVLGFKAKDPTGYGRLITTADKLLGIVEEKDADADQREITNCNSGLMAITAPQLWELLAQLKNQNAQGEYYLTDVVAAAQQACFALTDENEVMGINDRLQLSQAETIFQTQKRHDHMRAGVTLSAPESVVFAYDTMIAADVTIGANVVFGTGVVVESGVEILPFCHLENCTLKSGAKIGPFARIRPGSIIGEDARIGNFVEIKNAQFGAGAKANHLSYIGDATVGANANIGAGTITCNYDGIKKHKTKIGAGAFIGSNSALVAPVTIGESTMIAAGSVITDDVPVGALGIARAEQKNIIHYQRKS
jgi:bifunctional UDP-N-acetylglucosamine pyrophosphorylase/glucosamine-1-phosphate N-acetyltransferase